MRLHASISQRLSRSSAMTTAAGLAAAAVAVALVTALVTVVEAPPLNIPDGSPLYLLGVVAVAALFGALPASAAAVSSVLVYDFLFVEPRGTLHVADPREWLFLVLFLIVALTVGRLTALQREREQTAERRAREAQASFAVSRVLATTVDLGDAMPTILDRLLAETQLERLWVALGPEGRERIVADTAAAEPVPTGAIVSTLVRTPGDAPARWVRAHVGAGAGEGADPGRAGLYRVRIEGDGQVLGSLWMRRPRVAGAPSREETRLLALTADQLALAVRREQLARQVTDAEVARRSDALKSALVSSVSHDFRTPLANIRAAAGALLDPATEWSSTERRAAVQTIDAEAERLDGLVRNILDLSRIESGALRPDLEVHDLSALVEPVVERLAPILGADRVSLSVDGRLPPVVVDAVFFDQILSNLLENAARYAAPSARVRISARALDGEHAELAVEDAGPGVPAASLARLFDRFYRVERGEGSRRGLGIGLSVVRGLVEAMGGTVTAERSDLGGLAVRVALLTAPPPPPEPVGS